MGSLGEPVMLNAVVHSFGSQLEYSANLSDEAGWIDFYRTLWPDMIVAVRIDQNSQYQKWGIDRKILLKNGKEFTIDEKKRKVDYGDILLESHSVCNFDYDRKEVISWSKPGWAIDQDKRCDFIAYAIPTAGKCYLLPFEILRQTCMNHFEEWSYNEKYYPKPAKNAGYTTVNFAIPFPVLQAAMWNTMKRQFGCLSGLPIAQNNEQTLLFQH
jgi:hypothetical protein